MVDALAVRLLEALPKNLISRGFGAAAEVPLPGPLQSAVNEVFARAADIDVRESERPPGAYRTLNDFFTRRLKPTARPIRAASNEAAVPVDGTLSEFGPIDDGTLIQAKGRRYSVLDLLDSWRHSRPFQSGAYATFYLSPRDYHRIHSPVAGTIEEMSYVPGRLFPVFPFAVEHVDDLFAVNERVTTFIEPEAGERVAVVKVGAACVGRIELSYHPMQSNRPPRRRRFEKFDEPTQIEPGEELGIFNLGSTVIVLVSDEEFVFAEELREGASVRMGETLGRWPL